jgi:hypothetical protein
MNGQPNPATAMWVRDATHINSVVDNVSESVLLLEMHLLVFSEGPTLAITWPQELMHQADDRHQEHSGAAQVHGFVGQLLTALRSQWIRPHSVVHG